MSRCDMEMCQYWGGDGLVCNCALFDIPREDMDRLDTPEEQDAMFDAWAASDEPLRLQAELDELERTDPKVRAAAESYDRMVERMTGRELPPRSP